MLQTGLIVGGWDKHEGGKIYGVPLGGTILEQPFAIGGVFSSYDKNYPSDDSALITYYFENCSFWLVVDGDYLFLL